MFHIIRSTEYFRGHRKEIWGSFSPPSVLQDYFGAVSGDD